MRALERYPAYRCWGDIWRVMGSHESKPGITITLCIPSWPSSHPLSTPLCSVLWGFMHIDGFTWDPLLLASGQSQPLGGIRGRQEGRKRKVLLACVFPGLQLLPNGPPIHGSAPHGASAILLFLYPHTALPTQGWWELYAITHIWLFQHPLLFLVTPLCPLQIFPSSNTSAFNQYQWNPASGWNHSRCIKQQGETWSCNQWAEWLGLLLFSCPRHWAEWMDPPLRYCPCPGVTTSWIILQLEGCLTFLWEHFLTISWPFNTKSFKKCNALCNCLRLAWTLKVQSGWEAERAALFIWIHLNWKNTVPCSPEITLSSTLWFSACWPVMGC